MKRDQLLAGVALFGGTCLCLVNQSVAATQPNVLVILADDLGYGDLGCQGATDFKTPNIDALAASGIRFTDGYVTSPQCSPSRAGLLSGISPARFGFINNIQLEGLPSKNVALTLPELLKKQGYVTGMIGKWHVDYNDKTRISIPSDAPWKRGFDYILKHDSGMAHYYPYRDDGIEWMVSRGREYRLCQKMEKETEPRFLEELSKDTYMTDYFSEGAVGFIRRNQNKPWFLYLAYNAPHTPMVGKAELLQKYSHIQNPLRRNFAAMMESLDDGVGQILAELKSSGQLENTLIWFLSDNGAEVYNASQNGPLSGMKGDVTEGGIRVPFIMSWPGMLPSGKVEGGAVWSLDILPTSLAAAGVEHVADIYEGKNLLPWLKGIADNPHDKLFWSWCYKAAVRIGDIKETRNGNDVKAVDGSVVPGHTFSDVRKNPGELADQALQSPEQQQMLSTELDAWLRKLSEDQGRLTPKHPRSESRPDVSITPVKAEESVLINDDFESGQGRWAVRGHKKFTSFSDGSIKLTGVPNGFPIAVYLPIEPVHLEDGQTLRVSADVSTTRDTPRQADIRMGLGFSADKIQDDIKMAVGMTGFHFSIPSGGIASGIRATFVKDTGNPEIFFNAPKAGRLIGEADVSDSVSSSPKTWIVEVTRKENLLQLSGGLGGKAVLMPVELDGKWSDKELTFNTIGFAYAFAPNEVLTIDNVKISLK